MATHAEIIVGQIPEVGEIAYPEVYASLQSTQEGRNALDVSFHKLRKAGDAFNTRLDRETGHLMLSRIAPVVEG